MKALAFKIEGETYCCRCAEDLAKVAGYPHLFFTLIASKKNLVRMDNETVIAVLTNSLHAFFTR